MYELERTILEKTFVTCNKATNIIKVSYLENVLYCDMQMKQFYNNKVVKDYSDIKSLFYLLNVCLYKYKTNNGALISHFLICQLINSARSKSRFEYI